MHENKSRAVVTTEQKTVRYLFIDISPFKSTNVKILLVSAAVAALGIYTPMISMVNFEIILHILNNFSSERIND